MILFGVDGMKAADNSIGSDAYKEGWERLFKKEQPKEKVIQKSTNSNEEVEKKKEEDILL